MITSSILFTPFQMKGLSLKNRITMTPFFTGYSNKDGTVSPLTLEHYKKIAASGVAMVVVENAAIDLSGSDSPFKLRVDHDQYIPGLTRLAESIHNEGAYAFLQINHAGRYAYGQDRLAPSSVKTGNVFPREMTIQEIERTVAAYAEGAERVKEAGFDGVEIHGATGYLIVQFLSSRTNHRRDTYGGSFENQMRFPLQVVDTVLATVGQDYPVGYRFLADEELPDGLHPEQTALLARELQKRRIAYLSVVGGTYDSFSLPENIEKQKQEGFMAHYADLIKKAVPETPIITAGRIQTTETAKRILEQGMADLIGLGRVLFADPLWPKKVMGIVADPIVKCEPSCSFCRSQRIVKGKPALCSQWDKMDRKAFLSMIGETEE